MRPSVFLGSLILAACAAGGAERRLQSELEAMFDSDQSHRVALQEIALQEGSDSPKLMETLKQQHGIDEANVSRLDEIVAAHGWPARSIVGEKAASAAFLVVQHADPATQRKYLPLLRAAVDSGEARAQNLALLEDRVLMNEGKRQRYGSQLRPNGKGGYELYPIEDEEKVDERREAVGLQPLADYAKLFGIVYKRK
jgi:hypothetical protein